MDSQSLDTLPLYSCLSRLQALLSQEGELGQTRVSLNRANYVEVKCSNKYLAVKVCRLYGQLKGIGYGLRIIVGREVVEDFPPVKLKRDSTMIQIADAQAVRSDWLKDPGNANLARFLAGQGSVSLHSTDGDRGYECGAVIPFLNNPRVLSKPPSELIGKPVEASKGVIGTKKRDAIEAAIAIKGNVEEFYDYEWGETDANIWNWEMKCSAIWLSEKEVLVVIENVQDWQKQYWKGLLKAGG